jgi:lactate dehydrogenase-like 2-hydroxyacid dehydrogenase
MDVLITQPIIASCRQQLEQRYTVHSLYESNDPDALLDAVGPSIRAVAGGNVDAVRMERLPALEIISCFGVGYDSVDVAAARMIGLSRKLVAADAFVREGAWEHGGFGLQTELAHKTLGVVGLGRIGKEIALRAAAMKMRIVYFGRSRQADVPYEYFADVCDMAEVCDWLVVVAPGGPTTDGIITRDVLHALGPKGRFVNVSRGSLVDQEAMIDLLESGELGGAALDVFDREPDVPARLRQLDNVILSPHQGSATVETRERMGALLLANIEAQLAGRPLVSPVV